MLRYAHLDIKGAKRKFVAYIRQSWNGTDVSLGDTLIVGPTAFMFSFFWDSLKAYVEFLPARANPFGREDVSFSQGWTAFYWAWWISWSPFVGVFIARVSRGRTVREFIIYVLLIPSFVCVMWMSIFGGTAIHQVIADNFAGVPRAIARGHKQKDIKQLPT